MKFNEKKVKVRGQEFVIREISEGDMEPIRPLFDDKKYMEAQREMIKVCVFVDGKVIGDDIRDMPFQVITKLGDMVSDMNMPDVGGKGKD